MISKEAWFHYAAPPSDQRIEEINKQLKHVGWKPRNPSQAEIDLTEELDNILRRTGKSYMDLPFYARISYFHWKYPDALNWAEAAFHKIYETPEWKLLLADPDHPDLEEAHSLAGLAGSALSYFQDLVNEIRSRGGDAVPEARLKMGEDILKLWEKHVSSKTREDYEERYPGGDFDRYAHSGHVGSLFNYWIGNRK